MFTVIIAEENVIKMFEEFLVEHIKDYIECNDECRTRYDINIEQIEDIASIVSNNEQIWEIIDMAIDLELEKYEREVFLK